MMVKPAWVVLACAGLGLSACGATLVVGAGTAVTRTVLQERTTLETFKDADIQLSLNNRMIQESGELFRDISTSVIEGRVVLTGSVPTRSNKITASRLAWETPGVRAVADELTVAEDSGTVAYLEDAWISSQLRLDLLTDREISSVNYTVETVDKVVHVTGLAQSVPELQRVIERAARVPGVAKVVSHVLTIDDPRRLATAPKPVSG